MSKLSASKSNQKYALKCRVRWADKDPRQAKETKRCADCGCSKLVKDFKINRHRSDGFASYCRSCAQQQEKVRKYGIKFIEGSICEICERPARDIDHDHQTNQTRGFLCMNCNRGLGQFKDNTENLKLAIEYLEKYR
jgi:hypothetical protein